MHVPITCKKKTPKKTNTLEKNIYSHYLQFLSDKRTHHTHTHTHNLLVSKTLTVCEVCLCACESSPAKVQRCSERPNSAVALEVPPPAPPTQACHVTAHTRKEDTPTSFKHPSAPKKEENKSLDAQKKKTK